METTKPSEKIAYLLVFDTKQKQSVKETKQSQKKHNGDNNDR